MFFRYQLICSPTLKHKIFIWMSFTQDLSSTLCMRSTALSLQLLRQHPWGGTSSSLFFGYLWSLFYSLHVQHCSIVPASPTSSLRWHLIIFIFWISLSCSSSPLSACAALLYLSSFSDSIIWGGTSSLILQLLRQHPFSSNWGDTSEVAHPSWCWFKN